MPNTYSQLYIHFVFAVQNRISIIDHKWRKDLYLYITGIIEKQGHKTYAINGMSDHVHLLISMNPKQSSSELMYHIKRSSSLWINEKKLVPGKFSWQEGFGAFSYGKSQLANVIRYIENQELHHKKQTFIDEYKSFLELFEVDYDERFVFKNIQ